MWPWPGWASYGPPPGETSPVVRVIVVLMWLGLIYLFCLAVIGPPVRRCLQAWQRAPKPAASSPAPEVGHRLKFEHSEPPVIVIDNSDPQPPPRPGRYALDWDK